MELMEAPNGPGTLVVGSPEPASDSEAHALEMAVTDVVTAVLSDVKSAQQVMSTASERFSHAAPLKPLDFCVVVERSVPARLPAPLWIWTLPLLLPSMEPAFYVPVMPVACPVWPLPLVGSAPSILASAPLASAPISELASALQNPGAMADAPSGLTLTSWADIIPAEDEEQEWACCATVPVDLQPELQVMDLINAVQLAYPEQIDQAAVAGIARSFWMVLTYESTQATLPS